MSELSKIVETHNRSAQKDPQIWKSLHYLNAYRVILAGIFVTSSFIESNLPVLGMGDPITFVVSAYTYLGLGIFASFVIHWRWAKFDNLVVALTMVDIACLTTIMHTSGGVESGLGMLIVVAIAGNSMLTNGKYASLIASMAAIAILTEQVIVGFDQGISPNYSHAGFLGAAVFATAMMSYVLSRKLIETEALAEQRGVDLLNMAEINEHVIKRLQSGVIVVDDGNQIRTINKSAWSLLGLRVFDENLNKDLTSISPELNQLLLDWKDSDIEQPNPFQSDNSGSNILPNFTRLSARENAPILIFLEDTARMNQQAQQIKLASLGRLTASIAHEIRNPLGAISHADQLLAESNNLDESDRRLTEIIHTHTERMNGIIENVLQLSRRGNAVPQDLELSSWIKKFNAEMVISQNISEDTIKAEYPEIEIFVRFDPTQLHQVIWNLCHNAIRFTKNLETNPKLEIKTGISENTQRAFLDILDHGPGIDEQNVHQIFEPFFTTDSKGSGLGLYIARELCELNHANLQYIPTSIGGCCFRIEFANIKTNT